MPFDQDLDPGLITGVKEEYKKAAFWLPFNAVEIQKVFNEQELETVSEFLKEVKGAANDNLKKAQAIEKYSAVVVKLLKLGKMIA